MRTKKELEEKLELLKDSVLVIEEELRNPENSDAQRSFDRGVWVEFASAIAELEWVLEIPYSMPDGDLLTK